jgi:hypothetical protein
MRFYHRIKIHDSRAGIKVNSFPEFKNLDFSLRMKGLKNKSTILILNM